MMTLASAAAAAAQPAEAIRYEVSFPAPQTHYVSIDAAVPTAGRPVVDLMMAVWTPGSYLVREYARHVEAFEARDAGGRPLVVEKTRKNRWRVTTGGAREITVRYRVYAREMSVRTNWVEDRFALLNGAPTFVTLVDSPPRPHEVRLHLPPGWERSVTALPEAPDGAPHHYRAPDYDTLVDSPIVAGTPEVHEFAVDGVPHWLVNVGGRGVWDGRRAADDLQRVVEETRRMWGRLPYERYVFLNLITEGSGGLEHRDSSVLMTSRWSTDTAAAYTRWLGLAAHEHFHAWNVKRLRPRALGPFDYEQENYTDSLWVAEGLTEYYSHLLLYRVGLIPETELLQSISADVTAMQTTPGRLVQPLDAASFDAWIKYYRPDENTSNSAVSYYTKGAVIGFLLDAQIRRATDGTRTLDDLMRLAYDRYSGEIGYTPDGFRAAAIEIAGREEVGAWLDEVVETTQEIDYRPALEWFGLQFRDETPAPRAWLGVSVRSDPGGPVVTRVDRGSPAAEGGVNVDDEILAVDGYRVTGNELDRRLGRYAPGDRVELLVSRRGEIRRLEVVLGTAPRTRWTIEATPNASADQRLHRRQW